jgi:16S rRNA (cytidine1402-2'-O)-methyltransferase
MKGKLILIGTSLGNLEDTSFRALRHLFEAKIILAEDTRVLGKYKALLKQKFEIVFDALQITLNSDQKIISYRDQNHERILPQVIQFLESGENVYLVSDSGMPAISDPGYKLVRDCLDSSFEVDVIPGPTAFASSLVISGFPTDKFSFLGFLPRKRGKLVSTLGLYLELGSPVIIYESPFRIIKTLEIIQNEFENVDVVVARELTKKFQQMYRGEVSYVIEKLKEQKLRGEFVLIIQKVKGKS